MVPRHIVGRVATIPPGAQKRAVVEGRAIAIFNVSGTFYALRDICPHQGAPLSAGVVVSRLTATEPGRYDFDPMRKLVKCPRHGFEYDLATGESWYDPEHDVVRAFEVTIEAGRSLISDGRQGCKRLVAETIAISVEDDYIVVEL
jgi:3-phenylpropionate/trans-cinnamate dioxygenase ferredoxin subunit